MRVPKPSRDRRRFTTCGLAAAAALFAAPTASADTSSWLSVTGGYALRRFERVKPPAVPGLAAVEYDGYDKGTALSFATGIGSDPNAGFVVGGLLRSTTTFTLGTDLGLAARFASGGFARGQWGLAFDAGVSWRLWKGASQYGRFPVQAMLVGGGPWGFELSVGADVANLGGDPQSRGFVALFGVDLLRLTVMRKGATDKWWENASPAGGRPTQK